MKTKFERFVEKYQAQLLSLYGQFTLSEVVEAELNFNDFCGEVFVGLPENVFQSI